MSDASALGPGPIRDLFESLNASGVSYVVLRGYLPLTELEVSADIDVLIARDDLDKAAMAASPNGWRARRIQVGRYPHVFFDYLGGDGGIATVLDVVTGLNYGRDLHELSPCEAVLRAGRVEQGVSVPDPWHACFLLVLHLLLDKSSMLPHHYDRLAAHRDLCIGTESSSDLLVRDFGTEALDLVREFLVCVLDQRGEGLSALRERVKKLPALRPRPFRSRVDRLRNRLRRRWMRPVRVAVVGLDGAGKGTLIKRFQESTFALPVGAEYLGYNSFKTAWFRFLLRQMDELVATDRGKSLRLRALDVLRTALLPLEILSRVRRAERGRAIVLYDRYPLPGLNPSSSESVAYHAARAIASLLARLIPHPDIVLFLDGEADVLWARKKEYDLSVFLETQKHYRQVIDSLQCERHVIRTDGALDEAVAAFVGALCSSPTLRRILYG